jgi:hypothetical protein
MLAASVNGAQRTFVSAGSGSDSNPCTRLAPCRSFTTAMTFTDPGGEVIVLDSGGYGAVVISQSVSIISPSGVYAGISGFTGAAIDVNAPSGYVSLRGLVLNGQGGTTGIKVENAITTHIENVLVTGFTGNCVEIVGGNATFVNDSIIRNCAAGGGVVVAPTGTTRVNIDSTRLEYNGNGLVANSGARVTMRNSFIAYSVYYGVTFQSFSLGTIEHVTVSDTSGFQTAAFYAAGGAHLTIRDSAAVRQPGGNGFAAAESPAGTTMVVDHCLASESNYNGFLAGAAGGSGTALLTISNSIATNSASNGIVAGLNGTVRAVGNIATRNTYGLNGQDGTFESTGNNVSQGNITQDILGTITPISTY